MVILIKNELNQFLNESKKELPYLMETESTSLQQARDDLHKAFKNSFKSKRHNTPKFHSKKKTRPSFRQTIRKDKRPVNFKKTRKSNLQHKRRIPGFIKQSQHKIQQHYSILWWFKPLCIIQH